LTRTLAGVVGALVVLSIVRAVVEDVEAPQAPLPENILYYALSTIAQSAAALVAILGAWGLWRLDQLQERDRHDEERQQQTERELRQLWDEHQRDVMGAVVTVVERPPMGDAPEQERMLGLRLEGIRASRQLSGDERRGFIDTLVTFLLGTLAILTLAIIGLAFVDTLWAWVRTVRTGIILASVGLGIGPVRCQTSPEPMLSRLQTLCDDGTRAVSTWSSTLQRWDTTITTSPRQTCTGHINPHTQQVEIKCR
jgi:hypothetical protein